MIRHGSRVKRESFDNLDDAIEGMERRSKEIQSEGPLTAVKTLRDYEPGQRVHARLELSTGGVLRGREAGLDVMGDGAFVVFEGGVRREQLELGGESPWAVVRRAFAEG